MSSPHAASECPEQSVGMISVSGVASPLLAGGALALAGVIVQQEDALRYPGVALLLLVGAMLLLIAAMQCGAWAVQHAGVSAEDGRWWSIANDDRRSASGRSGRIGTPNDIGCGRSGSASFSA